MTVVITDTTGIGVDTTAPYGYSTPTPVQEFRWDIDGTIKWKKSTEDIMTGGSYVIETSDNSGTTWTELTSVTQASISEVDGSYRDTAGSPGRLYRIKKVTSASYGTKSSIYVGYGSFWESTTDKCYVMVYLRDLKLVAATGMKMKVTPDVASTVTKLTYKNKTIIPVEEVNVTIEDNSGLIIIPLIPSALITNSSAAVKYNFKIVWNNDTVIEYTSKTVPTVSSAYLIDLT